MRAKFEINNSDSYEYLIHGQDLKIEFQIPYTIFTIVNYKQLHTRIWLHKLFSSIYYKAPFVLLYNFLINHNFPGFGKCNLLATNFDYPGTSYKYKTNFIPNCILDNKIKIKSSKGVINTIANYHYPTINFIGIGFGFRIYKKNLIINMVDLKDEVITIKNDIKFPIIAKDITMINSNKPEIELSQNSISINKANIELKPKLPTINLNKSLTNLIISKTE